MRIALIGFGSMGQLVAHRARSSGDEIGLTLTSADARETPEVLATRIIGHDVAIDFSTGDAVLRNIEACGRGAVPLIEGTTGWNAHAEEVRIVVEKYGAVMVYGANFSIGVNIFYRIVSYAAELFHSVSDYAPFIEEAHHSRKRDAPSGTALQLRELMAKQLNTDIPIASTRAGSIPGTHRVGFDSAADQMTLTHMARSREGFAAGALLAAHWVSGRKGFYEFSEVIDEILKGSNV